MAIKTIKVQGCTCERCGYEWQSKVDTPIACPGCKSPYWNRPRRKHAKAK